MVFRLTIMVFRLTIMVFRFVPRCSGCSASFRSTKVEHPATPQKKALINQRLLNIVVVENAMHCVSTILFFIVFKRFADEFCAIA
jgi:hypothetical protein